MHQKKYVLIMIARTDYKYIGLHSGWNKRKSGLGGVRVEIFEDKLGLGLCRTRQGDTVKSWPLQTSITLTPNL
jgi:hypothetical protein